jgi:hypothetical protein
MLSPVLPSSAGILCIYSLTNPSYVRQILYLCCLEVGAALVLRCHVCKREVKSLKKQKHQARKKKCKFRSFSSLYSTILEGQFQSKQAGKSKVLGKMSVEYQCHLLLIVCFMIGDRGEETEGKR